jgi:phenylacetate-CoA ligase
MLSYFSGYVLYPILEKYSKRQINPKLIELRAFEQKSNADQKALQRENCFQLLSFCKDQVPYYQDLFKSVAFDIEKIRKDIGYLNDVPILTKALVRENAERLRTANAHHVRKTGGSTGQSVYFYYDNPGLDWTSAMNLYSLELAGKKPHHKDCHISAELGLEPPTFKGKFLDWLKLTSQNRTRLMISSFSPSDLDALYDELVRKSPFLLQGHPSTAYAIAAHFLETGRKQKLRFSVFEPTGEMLTDKAVQTIEKAFGCKVVNRYGNAECGVMAHSLPGDPYTRLKIFQRAFYLAPIEKGPLIVTNFTNLGFPLINYDTGDIGTVRSEPNGDYLSDIQGRKHDTVTINRKEFPTHFIMDYLDHKVRGIREFQIHLTDSSDPLLKVVLENPSDQSRVLAAIKAYWEKGLNVEFVGFESLETVGWRNKFRHVIDKRSKLNEETTSNNI